MRIEFLLLRYSILIIRRIEAILRILLVLLFLIPSGYALAEISIVPGSVCPADGRVVHTGGPETGGTGHMMVCESGTWKSILSFDGTGRITSLGQQVCSNGQVLSYNSGQWVCSNKGELQCSTVLGPACPAGYIKTGNTPDLLLGLGTYPVCCRVQ